jgi:hypothetical protein
VPGTAVLTDKQLRDAMERADMPPRDYRIFGALVFRADWASGVIPKQFQPRSLTVLANITRMSRASVAEGLNHLERHGWVTRTRQGPGRGKSTVYGLRIGVDCNCAGVNEVNQAAPKTEAERARAYRERKKASRIRVTEDPEASGIGVTKRPASRDEDAGQNRVCAKEGRDEGGRGWGAFVRKASSWD